MKHFCLLILLATSAAALPMFGCFDDTNDNHQAAPAEDFDFLFKLLDTAEGQQEEVRVTQQLEG